jgi:hypothetical protein
MRIERMILAVVVSMLAIFAVQGAAVASADPGMTHDGVEMIHE